MAQQKACWNCGEAPQRSVFCSSCGRIQPCDHSQNPFDVFSIEPTISLDREELTSAFFALSRSTHPDFFGSASAQEQAFSLEHSAQINDAYRRLSSFHGRVTAYLESHDLTEAIDAWKPPTSLLMQVLEWNEELDELAGKNPESRQKALGRLRDEVGRIHEETVRAVSEYKEGADERLLDMVGRIQYIARLKERIEQSS